MRAFGELSGRCVNPDKSKLFLSGKLMGILVDELPGELVRKLNKALGWYVQMNVSQVLLGLLPSPAKKKLNRKFVLLGLVPTKRRIVVAWLSLTPPTYAEWLKDVSDWVIAEEVQMRHVYRDDKFEDDIHAWSTMLIELRESKDLAVSGAGAPDTA
ncbi:hypothetical protein NDU88_002005 [Pleurodeles waltl]|uniref:Uncharacterized protein n=1 Tax=Pleurodeles waltl TaxID=8319 RepID=A0AAV7TLT6_PLEWA|nr:hypothetical protein NDU88_002005 [Pleurodeles waltl]